MRETARGRWRVARDRALWPRGVMRLWDALFAFGVHLDVRHTHTHPAPSLAKSRGPEIARQVLLCVAHIMLRRDALLSDLQRIARRLTRDGAAVCDDPAHIEWLADQAWLRSSAS